MTLSSSIPRFVDLAKLRADPLLFLLQAEAAAKGLVVISESGSIFSRAQSCAGVVAVFGPTAIRQVLSDADRFGMAISVGERFSLPPRLMRLNSALFSMREEQHRSRQKLLTSVLGSHRASDYFDMVTQGWNAYSEELGPGEELPLLSEMRRLVLNISERLIFGTSDLALGRLIQSYFDHRRRVSGMRERFDPQARRTLVGIGSKIDRMIRDRLAALRSRPSDGQNSRPCLLARLAKLETADGERLSDDELVAHANVLFMSSSEPVAVALTWALLLLSQHADMQRAVRRELVTAFGDGDVPEHFEEADLPALRGVVQESLRLLPPNAIMVRLTTDAASIAGHELPPRCEVVISPYVAQRDPRVYARPHAFDPGRWRDLKPAAYSYLPFGAGARHCIGKSLASHTLTAVLARILKRFHVVLSDDQDIDWKMDITMMPTSEPIMRFVPISASAAKCSGGRLGGPVAALAHLPSPTDAYSIQ
ncbi:MAG: cytochrome P450 [Bradyrhizobium sp.]